MKVLQRNSFVEEPQNKVIKKTHHKNLSWEIMVNPPDDDTNKSMIVQDINPLDATCGMSL